MLLKSSFTNAAQSATELRCFLVLQRIGGSPAPPLGALPPLPGTGPGASFVQQQGPNQPGPNRPVNMRSFVQESRNTPVGSLPTAGNPTQSFQQQGEDNVIHDGPLAGGILTDSDIHPTDPSTIPQPLDPRYLVRNPKQPEMKKVAKT